LRLATALTPYSPRGWLELHESDTFVKHAKRRGPLRLSVGARVSPLSCPQRFTNLRQA
jgi:hypothetical protein